MDSFCIGLCLNFLVQVLRSSDKIRLTILRAVILCFMVFTRKLCHLSSLYSLRSVMLAKHVLKSAILLYLTLPWLAQWLFSGSSGRAPHNLTKQFWLRLFGWFCPQSFQDNMISFFIPSRKMLETGVTSLKITTADLDCEIQDLQVSPFIQAGLF